MSDDVIVDDVIVDDVVAVDEDVVNGDEDDATSVDIIVGGGGGGGSGSGAEVVFCVCIEYKQISVLSIKRIEKKMFMFWVSQKIIKIELYYISNQF